MKIHNAFAWILVAGAASLAAPDAKSADLGNEAPPSAPAPAGSEWTFTIAPYLWAAGLQGDIGLFGRQPVHVDMSFGDIFDNLRFGGMVVGEAHNGTWDSSVTLSM
jgi:hypothetical protein